jgi:arylsulfatase A-like enzyme/Flp pilus assembly protein TadD
MGKAAQGEMRIPAAFLVFLISGAPGRPLFSAADVRRDAGLNVLLVTLDTTRPDRLGAYGYDKARTPALDALAAGGVRFANAYCQVPMTLPSHCSILTGTGPLAHKVRNNGTYFLSQEMVTLAERLKERGYRTAAFVSSFNVDSRFGVAQGFDIFDDQFGANEMIKTFRSERGAGETSAAFLRWLDGMPGGPFFSWVHYYDPHMPYDPPSPFKEQFQDPYDGEIAYMDASFAKILEGLRKKGLLENTLIVVAGDHGEAFGEKKEVSHGLFIYDATMKVPLLFHAPRNIPRGRVVDARVRLIDIMPTILDALKMPANKEVQGRSLLPYIEGRRSDDLPCYLECYYPLETYGWSELVGLIDNGKKFIKAPRPELYDLKSDPGESRDLVQKEAGAAAAMMRKLQAMIVADSSDLAPSRRKLSREEEERLRSLGYVAGDASVRVGKGPLPDPKDKVDEFQIIYRAVFCEEEGKWEEAEKSYREILRLQPDVAWRYVDLAIFLSRRERLPQAIDVLRQGLSRMPDSFVILTRLAHFEMRAGRFDEAFEMSQAALRIDPGYFDALVIAAAVEDVRGNLGEAERLYGQALEIEPENRPVRIKHAYALAALGRGEEAAGIDEALKKEVPDDIRLLQDLGVIYGGLGRWDLAEENLRKAVELQPSPETWFNFASVLEQAGKLADAVRYLKLYLEKTPEGETPRKANARKALADWQRRLKAPAEP